MLDHITNSLCIANCYYLGEICRNHRTLSALIGQDYLSDIEMVTNSKLKLYLGQLIWSGSSNLNFLWVHKNLNILYLHLPASILMKQWLSAWSWTALETDSGQHIKMRLNLELPSCTRFRVYLYLSHLANFLKSLGSYLYLKLFLFCGVVVPSRIFTIGRLSTVSNVKMTQCSSIYARKKSLAYQ